MFQWIQESVILFNTKLGSNSHVFVQRKNDNGTLLFGLIDEVKNSILNSFKVSAGVVIICLQDDGGTQNSGGFREKKKKNVEFLSFESSFLEIIIAVPLPMAIVVVVWFFWSFML